jgi:hypothetical protein
LVRIGGRGTMRGPTWNGRPCIGTCHDGRRSPAMRRLRVRLRIWRLMAAIAATGLVLGAWIEVPRLRALSRSYRGRAAHYAELERRALLERKQQGECLAFWSALAAELSAPPTGARARLAMSTVHVVNATLSSC